MRGAYVINRKHANDSGTVATGALTFDSTPLVVLFDSTTTYSFISSKATSHIGLILFKCPVNLYVNFPAEKTVKCDFIYKNFPITLNQEEFAGDLVWLDLSKFNIIL